MNISYILIILPCLLSFLGLYIYIYMYVYTYIYIYIYRACFESRFWYARLEAAMTRIVKVWVQPCQEKCLCNLQVADASSKYRILHWIATQRMMGIRHQQDIPINTSFKWYVFILITFFMDWYPQPMFTAVQACQRRFVFVF